ncbi:hypothetical protein B0H16DRAFT_1524189 [Mycena metata]|uniref:Cytochrome P450 n=1 Tax=Mycena metata TaxID=1033252 RepID=A0AAD7JIS8_9AGAR|nr:hypothetical protein B0H16DRAFT_1524189 [Mycena metata]
MLDCCSIAPRWMSLASRSGSPPAPNSLGAYWGMERCICWRSFAMRTALPSHRILSAHVDCASHSVFTLGILFIGRIYRHRYKRYTCKLLVTTCQRKMTNAFEFYGICFSMIIFSIILLSPPHREPPSRPPIIHNTPAAVRTVLDPPTTSMNTLLRSRASPNTRLHRTFHLSNTFVNPDPAVHAAFLRQSRALLQTAKRDWNRFNNVALQAVELSLPNPVIPFHVFVRAATLRTVIVGLLDPRIDITSLASSDLDVVGQLITDLWLLSKNPEHIPEHLLEMLNHRLRRLVPDDEKYPNPLDFVIPTFETLWRLVAVTLAHVHRDAAACGAFRDFNENPSCEQFQASRLGGTSPSVENYISETLRFDPPVRHITRHVDKQSLLTANLPRFLAAWFPPRTELLVADIETAQRTPFWESDKSSADVYDAARFLREPTASHLLAFGCGPLKCAAINWAPRAAAVIVGATLNRVDGVGHYIVRGPRIGGREGWDRWEVRTVS